MFDDDLKTVEVEDTPKDPLLKKQKSDIDKMRSSLLQCETDSNLARVSLNNIVVLQIYHQMSRIIRYLDIMDKLEEKLYDSLDYQIENADETDMSDMMALLSIQEKLQKSMIESNKLLEPYMNISEFAQLQAVEGNKSSSKPTTLLDASERDNLRNAAQAVLKELGEE